MQTPPPSPQVMPHPPLETLCVPFVCDALLGKLSDAPGNLVASLCEELSAALVACADTDVQATTQPSRWQLIATVRCTVRWCYNSTKKNIFCIVYACACACLCVPVCVCRRSMQTTDPARARALAVRRAGLVALARAGTESKLD